MICAESDFQHTYLNVFYGEEVVCTANHHNQILARLFMYLKAFGRARGSTQSSSCMIIRVSHTRTESSSCTYDANEHIKTVPQSEGRGNAGTKVSEAGEAGRHVYLQK